MSAASNVVIVLIILFFVLGIGIVWWKGTKIVEIFARRMFSGRQAERERRRQAAGAEEAALLINPLISALLVRTHTPRRLPNSESAPVMAARPVLRGAGRIASTCCSSHSRCAARHIATQPRTFSTGAPLLRPSTTSSASSTHDSSRHDDSTRTTHFGFQDGLSESEKTERVAGVFHSVAESYDRMNDLMSFGWHRVWKDHFVSSLDPGHSSSIPPAPQRILDVAGGTGDIAFRMLHHSHVVNANPNVHITISDINPSMLAVGKQRALALPAAQQATLSFLEADATQLPAAIPAASLDLYTVAFGIRNFANVPAALAEAHRVLKPGGVFACLEFSKVASPAFDALYKRWSFSAIPLIGQLVAGDRDSYQYLVESIERFPSQDRFRRLIEEAGFVVGGSGYENLTGGVAAIHKGMKPLS
ncbi:ubiquinone/menaquinone biosynthesis methyltransferase [Nemania serpens]|nr:ubiquinone/menaquinone biosynthesis methyltransferase [Nemania serpens]